MYACMYVCMCVYVNMCVDVVIIQQGQQEVDDEMAHYRERWAHHVRVIGNICHKCRARHPATTSSIPLSNIPKDTVVSLVDRDEVQTIYKSRFFFSFVFY